MNYEIAKEEIHIQAVIDKVVRREAGAITTFIKFVRELTNGKKTLFLIYEAYEAMAVKKLERMGRKLKNRWPGAKVAITHRVGKLEITDVAVVIAVSTPHRADAYEANRYAIERIKEIVPIWKKNIGKTAKDGSEISWRRSPILTESPMRGVYMNKVLFFAHLRDMVGAESVRWMRPERRLLNSRKYDRNIQTFKNGNGDDGH